MGPNWQKGVTKYPNVKKLDKIIQNQKKKKEEKNPNI